MLALAISNLFSNIKGENNSTALGIITSGAMMRSFPSPAEYSRQLPNVSRQNFKNTLKRQEKKSGCAETLLGKKRFCDIVLLREIPDAKTKEPASSCGTRIYQQ